MDNQGEKGDPDDGSRTEFEGKSDIGAELRDEEYRTRDNEQEPGEGYRGVPSVHDGVLIYLGYMSFGLLCNCMRMTHVEWIYGRHREVSVCAC